MKIIQINYLINHGKFANSPEFKEILDEVYQAIGSVTWPKESDNFVLYPEKKRNGVKPIKLNCMSQLSQKSWDLECRIPLASRVRPGPIDAVKRISDGRLFAIEWETGNISSTHRALNKMAVGLIEGKLAGGILILPSRSMYKWLTDRIGSYEEIEPYFPMWQHLRITNGVLGVIEIEHDAVSLDVPPIPKGTDGRALR